MNNILSFTKRTKPPVFSSDKEALSIILYLKRLKRSGEAVHQETGFSLADQVLTYLLVDAGLEFDLVVGDIPSDRQSILSITSDRYGLELREGIDGLNASSLLNDWPVEALVQYVLDHEIPVDPRDVPGFEILSLAG